MKQHIFFIQVHERPGVIEAEVVEAATLGDLHKAIEAAGVIVDAELKIFLDEAEEPLQGDHGHAVAGLRHGSRIHVTRCKRIKATVHYLERTAERIFGALGSPYRVTTSDEGDTYYEADGLGFRAELFDYDPYVEYPALAPFSYELDIISRYWCVDLDAAALEESLSEYYARELAFELNVETANEVPVETTEEFERMRIRVFRRNPQFRTDQAPTTPRVFLVEEHFREVPFDQDEYEDVEGEEDEPAAEEEDANR